MRLNGGKLGVYHNTTPGTSSGVYKLDEVQAMQSAAVWPVFPADPNFASVVLCTHFHSQLNDPTSFVNTASSNLTKTLGANGTILNNGYITTAAPSQKWYSTSFVLGTSRAQVSATANFTIGNSDFTIEGWFMTTNLAGGNQDIFDCRQGEPNTAPLLYYGADTRMHYYVNGVDNKIQSAINALAINTWTHIALCRVSGNTRLYVAGTQVGATFVDATNYAQSAAFCVGASFNGSSGFIGYVEEVRYTIGFGRYSGTTLTVPTAPFPDSA